MCLVYAIPWPVIFSFDKNHLNNWTFVRRLKTYIAQRMTSELAKLVYLLQHCALGMRKNLEH